MSFQPRIKYGINSGWNLFENVVNNLGFMIDSGLRQSDRKTSGLLRPFRWFNELTMSGKMVSQ
jgi:hypothetical protein